MSLLCYCLRRANRLLALGATIALALRACPVPAGESPPNFVLIVADNLGGGDLGCYGSTLHRTPHIDTLAREGTRFTSFYVTSGVCTPSRASFLTGCYPLRVNMHTSDTNGAVLQPVSPKGLHSDEITLAEILGEAGYATACIGKWHLGDQLPFLPTRQGFQHYFGIPYSDDMTRDKRPDHWPELPLMRGETVIEAPADRDLLVQRCTEEALTFITKNQHRPFFLYLPHTMPGSTDRPFASPEFSGRSRNGPYGDSVEELDWSTGQILTTLQRLGLDHRTLIIWTSDNGAVRRDPPQGSNAPYKGWGYDTSEGAMRMPCLARWPGKIPAGQVCDELITAMDFLPTFARLSSIDLPADRVLDGHDIRRILWADPTARSPYDEVGFFYYRMDQLQAVRAGPWKLYLPLETKFTTNARKTAPAKLELYDVRHDVGEEREVSADHRSVVDRLTGLAERAREQLGDAGRRGNGQRPAGWVDRPQPLRKGS